MCVWVNYVATHWWEESGDWAERKHLGTLNRRKTEKSRREGDKDMWMSDVI